MRTPSHASTPRSAHCPRLSRCAHPSPQDEQQPRAAARGSDGSSRPLRAASNVFSSPSDGGAQVADGGVAEASAEWQAATPGIVADMRAHLERRQKSEEVGWLPLQPRASQPRGDGLTTLCVCTTCEQADLIGKGPIRQFVDFFRSQYFRNVRQSLGVFLGAWLWYVLNSRTYIRPDYDE